MKEAAELRKKREALRYDGNSRFEVKPLPVEDLG